MLLHYLMRWLMGDDEITGEPYYDKISDWEKNHNMIVPAFNTDDPTDYFKVPLPYGVNFFWALGNVLSDYSTGKPGASLALNLAMAASESFSPMPIAESQTGPGMVAKAAVPTATVPVAAFLMNEDQFGREIWPENLPFGLPKPDSELYFKSVNPMIKSFAQSLHKATGGTKFNDNGIDWSPESIEYLATYYTAGLGKFVNNSVATVARAMDPNEEVDWARAPFISRFYGRVSPAIAVNRYREATKDVETVDKEVRYNASVRDVPALERNLNVDQPFLDLLRKQKKYDGRSEYDMAKSAIKKADDLKDALKEANLLTGAGEKTLDSIKSAAQRKFTKKVNDAKYARDLLK